MSDARQIIDALGRGVIAVHLGISHPSVSNAYDANMMPANWFCVVESLCLEAGIECPRRAFRFRADSARKPYGSQDGQGAASLGVSA